MNIQKEIEILRKKLKQNGYKLTPQRRSTYKAILVNEGSHLSCEEVYNEVKKDCPEIGLATVYRTLMLLNKINVIKKQNFNEGKNRYEMIKEDKEHHHHLICNKCASVVEFEDDILEDFVDKVADKYKFDIIDHRIKLFGYCEECMNKSK